MRQPTKQKIPDDQIQFLVATIPAKFFTTPTLPSAKDIINAVNALGVIRQALSDCETIDAWETTPGVHVKAAYVAISKSQWEKLANAINKVA